MKRPMTPRGYAALRAEVLRLKSTRVELARAIEIARGHGDLSENGDYDAAKEKSGMTEARIRDIDAKLAEASVIDASKISSLDRVVFGVTLKIEDVESGETKSITLVGADESNIEQGLVSFESPLGKGLIGKELGDIAKVHTPGGSKEYEILEIILDPSVFATPEAEEISSNS